MRLRLLVACSFIPLAALVAWAAGSTTLGLLLVVVVAYALVLGYALLFEGGSEARVPARLRFAARRDDVRAVESRRPSSSGQEPEGAAPAEQSPEQPQAGQEQSDSGVPPVPRFERPASLLAGIAARMTAQPGPEAARPESAGAAVGGRWNVWALERLANERLSKESDYERSLLLVYLRDFASSDGTLPPEFNGLVESAFPDLIGEVAADRR